MFIQEIKNTWLKLATEIEQKLLEAKSAEEKSVYQYILENVIPDEIKLLNESDELLTDDDYIQIALDHHGAAIRDNSREEKIAIGKSIENGEE